MFSHKQSTAEGGGHPQELPKAALLLGEIPACAIRAFSGTEICSHDPNL